MPVSIYTRVPAINYEAGSMKLRGVGLRLILRSLTRKTYGVIVGRAGYVESPINLLGRYIQASFV